MSDKIHLFEARTEGYRTYRVPGILTTESGVLIGTAEARRGQGGDWDGNDIVARRSDDGGKTWGPLQTYVSCDDYGPGPISNFVMISDRDDGQVQTLFCHNYARVFSIRSDDDGETWSDPVEVTEMFELFRS